MHRYWIREADNAAVVLENVARAWTQAVEESLAQPLDSKTADLALA